MGFATLSIDFIARLANIERDLGRVGSIAERSARQMESAFTGASSVIESSLKGLAGAFTVGAIAQMVQSSINAADGLAKLSQRTGESVRALQEFQALGSLTDTTNEEMANGLKTLAKRMSDAANGSGEAAGAFKAMGVSVLDSSGKLRGGIDVVKEIAEKFSGYEDGVGKAALASALFGEELGARLIPLLNTGKQGFADAAAEVTALGGAFSEDAAKGAEKFNDDMARLNRSMAGLGNAATTALLPILNELTSSLVEMAKDGDAAAGGFNLLTESFRAVVQFGGNVAFVFRGIGTEIGGMAAQLAALGRLDFQAFSNIGEAMREDAEASRKAFDAWEVRIKNAGNTLSASAEGTPAAPRITAPRIALAGTTRTGGGRVAKAIDDGQRLVEQLRDQVRATQELSNVEKLELAIADGKYKTATAGNLELARGYAQILDNIAATKEAAAAEAEAWRERLSVLAEGERVFAATRTPMEALDAELLNLVSLLDAGAISMDTFGRAASMAGENFLKINDQVKETEDVLNEFAQSGARNIQSAFADFLFDPFKDGMQGMLQSFGNIIKQMIAQAVAADLTKRIFGDLSQGGLGTGWLGSLGNLFTNADGGVYNSPGLSQYSGQVVSQPTFFAFARGGGVMGEAGPEAILPLERGASGKLGVRASGGGGHSFTFNLNGVTNEADGRRAAGQISRRVLGVLAGAQRYA